jgi:hypothetical protein
MFSTAFHVLCTAILVSIKQATFVLLRKLQFSVAKLHPFMRIRQLRFRLRPLSFNEKELKICNFLKLKPELNDSVTLFVRFTA